MSDQDILMQGPGGANVALETLDMMRLHGVPATSANYEVWLEYRLGRNQPLREAIDARIASGGAFSVEENTQLHERFFTSLGASSQIVLAGEKIARDLGQVVSFLKDAEERSGDYGRKLETAATDLNRGLGPEQIRQIVSSTPTTAAARCCWPSTPTRRPTTGSAGPGPWLGPPPSAWTR